jgi:phospholipase/carboxylesterase
MHKNDFVFSDRDLTKDAKVLVMIHGRGASPEDILSLSHHLNVGDFALVAPRATGNTWYPYSFLAPPAQNEPWLSSALELLSGLLQDLFDLGIPPEHIYFLGFSQGACLTLEFVTRNAARYGGVAAFTGGLIGDRIYSENYSGDFAGTPVFIGTSDPDPHVPVERVYATAKVLEGMNARVVTKVYSNMGHTISPDEINNADWFIFNQQSNGHV